MSDHIPPHRAKDVVDESATHDDRTYAMLMHLSTILIHVIGIPVVIPLIMWVVKKDKSPYIDDHGKEVVNFHLSLLIWTIIVVVVGFITLGLGFILFLPLYAVGIYGLIAGSIAAYHGKFFRYPVTWRLLK